MGWTGTASQRQAHSAAEAKMDEVTWTRARRYAETQGLTLTKPLLRALVTQEVFDLSEPVAVLVRLWRIEQGEDS